MAVLKAPSEFRIARMTDSVIFLLGMFVVTAIAIIISAMMGFKLMANLRNVYVFMSFFLIPSTIINYLLLWRKDKYLSYFKKFDKESASGKRKWAWITFGVTIGIILLLILSIEVSSKMQTG